MQHLKTENNTSEYEDSLSGLHQAVKCNKQVKWRLNSKKIIILATDHGYQQIHEKAKVIIILYVQYLHIETKP